jgi:SAM-dependent methyltransferase
MSLLTVARPFLKRILPARVRRTIHRFEVMWIDGQFRNLSRSELFDSVYREEMWVGTDRQLSGFGSIGSHADEYVSYVRGFVREHAVGSILDVGCGDFGIGSKICSAVSKYVAADVSKVIIERNRVEFAFLENTRFECIDVCADALPKVDLITIREVLQHLSNDDVEAALANLERSGARFVLVTEHQPAPDVLVAPNIDKPRGPNIRNPFGSGVYIALPPFARLASDVLSVKHPSFARAPSYLVTTLWDLQADRA